MSKKVLITGGAGFLGTALVNKLSKSKDLEIFVIDSFTHGFPAKFPQKSNVQNPIAGNVRNFYDIYHTLDRIRPDVIYHLAAHVTRPEATGNIRLCAEVNYVGTVNLLDACTMLKDKRPSKIIFSSCESVRNPSSHMGASKRAAETVLESLCSQMGVSVATLRFSEIYGYSSVNTSLSIVNFLIDKFLTNTNVGLPGEGIKKDHLHLDDAVKALEILLKADFKVLSQVDIGTGQPVPMENLAETLKEACKSKSLYKFTDSPYLRMVDSVADPSRAQELFGFSAQMDFAEAIKEQIKKRKKELK